MGTPTALIQIARIGNEFILLKKTPEGVWDIHQRYRRTDMPEELPVRMQPAAHNTQVIKQGCHDLVAAFDYSTIQKSGDSHLSEWRVLFKSE